MDVVKTEFKGRCGALDVVMESVSADVVHDDSFLGIYHNERRFNAMNHWKGTESADPSRYEPPAHYNEWQKLCDTSRWAPMFWRSFHQINIDATDLLWLKEAAQIGKVTGRVSRLFTENIRQAAGKYHDPVLFTTAQPTLKGEAASAPTSLEWFVRTERVSLKSGQHGAGPYTNMTQILESLCTGRATHAPVNEDTRAPLTLFLTPWRRDWSSSREFRVFVHNGRVTAVSQQHLHKPNELLCALEQRDRVRRAGAWIEAITRDVERTFVRKLAKLEWPCDFDDPGCDLKHSYVMDVMLCIGGSTQKCGSQNVHDGIEPVDDNTAQQPDLDDATNYTTTFIEINPYGQYYSSGSSLFHWVKDHCKLYRQDAYQPVYFRYTTQ